MEDTPFDSQNFSSPQPHHFYAELFHQLPVMVVRLTTDGIVLEINTQVTLVSGYSPEDIVGRNFWGTLFPGKLFAQVPKFISPNAPWGLFRDYPMAIRTRNGVEKIIAWTRFMRLADRDETGTQPTLRQEIICIGQDLTNRLTDAEKKLVEQQQETGWEDFKTKVQKTGKDKPDTSGEDLGATGVEGETVEPLAVSPPRPPGGTVTPEALAHLQESLEALGQRMSSLQTIITDSQLARIHWLDSMKQTMETKGFSTQFLALEKAVDPETIGVFENMQSTTAKMSQMCSRGKTEEENNQK